MKKKHILHMLLLCLVFLFSFVSCNQAAENSVSSSRGAGSASSSRRASSAQVSSSADSGSSSGGSSSGGSSSGGSSSGGAPGVSSASASGSSSGGSGKSGGGGGSGKTTVGSSAAKGGSSAQNASADAWPSSGGVPSPVYIPNNDGGNVFANDDAVIDLSYTSYGFVKIRLAHPVSSRAKVSIQKSGNYYYDLSSSGGTEAYPLQMGNGTYTISVYVQASSGGYAMVASTSVPVSLMSSQIPYLVPSQQVNYTSGSRAASTARGLVSGMRNNYERVSAVLSYVASHLSYNYSFAKTVQSGYVPDVDADLARGSGICYDYAAVAAAMLRSLGYPTKLETGWVDHGAVYHAWNEVYLSGSGWVKVMSVRLDTRGWSRVDVTFISTSNSSSSIAQYIESDGNYRTVYTY